MFAHAPSRHHRWFLCLAALGGMLVAHALQAGKARADCLADFAPQLEAGPARAMTAAQARDQLVVWHREGVRQEHG